MTSKDSKDINEELVEDLEATDEEAEDVKGGHLDRDMRPSRPMRPMRPMKAKGHPLPEG